MFIYKVKYYLNNFKVYLFAFVVTIFIIFLTIAFGILFGKNKLNKAVKIIEVCAEELEKATTELED